jgi:hypothetical protein
LAGAFWYVHEGAKQTYLDSRFIKKQKNSGHKGGLWKTSGLHSDETLSLSFKCHLSAIIHIFIVTEVGVA